MARVQICGTCGNRKVNGLCPKCAPETAQRQAAEQAPQDERCTEFTATGRCPNLATCTVGRRKVCGDHIHGPTTKDIEQSANSEGRRRFQELCKRLTTNAKDRPLAWARDIVARSERGDALYPGVLEAAQKLIRRHEPAAPQTHEREPGQDDEERELANG